jgi:copper homeostasis protein
MLLEIACFNLRSCLIAQKAGAHRIELCENYKAGGITPSQNLIIEARKNLQIDLFVMIRPREGIFFYYNSEFEQMKSQIKFCKENKCNGIVFGILTAENKVDKNRCEELVELAKPMQCTFHRAFDEIENSDEALEDIINCGFSRVLSSGKQKTAIQGFDLIDQLIKKANGRIIIIPGGGIRSANISDLKEKTNAREFHSAAIINSGETTDETEIKNLLAAL